MIGRPISSSINNKRFGIGTMRRASGGTPTPTTDDTIWYGQSNSLNHFFTSASPPAATSGTQVWDPGTSAWITPVGNGIREYLNAMTAATGLPSRAVYGGQSGVNISALQKGAGTGYYEALLARIVASGIVPKRICFHHGEGDANTASPVGAAYQTAMDTLHGSIVADLGLTKATCPMIISSLATVTDGSFVQPDTSWQTIKDAQALVNATYANIHYSHSNMDATLSDGIHWNGGSYGRSGKRYARTAQVLMGSVSTRPKWFATAAVRVSTTETDITVVHEMGADFTPTSGITGFDVTGNNGSNWYSATGARIDATTIRLTHTAVGTTERKVRYQYGKLPTVSAAVVDDSSLSNLLNFTSADLVAPGAAPLPTITYATSVNTTVFASPSQGVTGVAVPGSTEALLALIGVTTHTNSYNFTTMSVTAQPSGTVIAATLVESHNPGGAPGAAIYQAQLPSGTTSISITQTFSVDPFSTCRFHVGTIPVANLTSTTKVGSGKQRVASSTTATVTLPTSADGVVFCVSVNVDTSGGNNAVYTGSESYTTRNSTITNGASRSVGDASGTAANASSSLTVTYPSTANTVLVAGSWR